LYNYPSLNEEFVSWLQVSCVLSRRLLVSSVIARYHSISHSIC